MRRLLLPLLLLAGCRFTPDSPDALDHDDAETGERCRGWSGQACGDMLVAACNVAGGQCELRRTDGSTFSCDGDCDCEAAARRALTECDP